MAGKDVAHETDQNRIGSYPVRTLLIEIERHQEYGIILLADDPVHIAMHFRTIHSSETHV